MIPTLSLSLAGGDAGAMELGERMPASTPGGRALRLIGAPHRALEHDERLVALATARVNVVLVDGDRGFDVEARREVLLGSLYAAPAVLLAVSWSSSLDEASFRRMEVEFNAFANELGVNPGAVVLVGSAGLEPPPESTWYRGPSLVAALDAVPLERPADREGPLRLSVTGVAEPGQPAGTIASGTASVGATVRVQPSGRIGKIAQIRGETGAMDAAGPGQPVTLVLDDPIEVAPGDLIASADAPAEVADQFEASIVWLGRQPLLRGRRYRAAMGPKELSATIAPLKHKLKVETLERIAAAKLETGEIGVCHVKLDQPIAFEPYRENRAAGSLLFYDAEGAVIGLGFLNFALRRAKNVHWQAIDVNRAARARQKSQRPCVLWYTGLSGAGKSTIANLVDKKLYALGRHSYLLDGDNVRHGLNKDLGFTAADRVENIRRIAEVAKLMVDAGLIVSTAFISPFRAERQMARSLLPEGDFIEVFIDTPLDVAETRDPKGLYKKARRGELKNFTGIDSPYEAPENPELRLDTTQVTPEQAAEQVVAFLEARGTLEES